LSFCVVYADIGTSIFYVPGILFLTIGSLAAAAQVMTTGVFILIARKYVEIAVECPDGGGVVSIAAKAFPRLGMLPLLGGSLITIDYFLTSAISGVSGFAYLQSLMQFDHGLVVPMTIAALLVLLVLNIVGLRESAAVNAFFAATKLCVAFILLGVSAYYITAHDGWAELWDMVIHPTLPGGRDLTMGALVIGYADTWLAYSGLESGAQISGAMKSPVRRTASISTWMVIGFISVLSPVLTAFAIRIVGQRMNHDDPEQVRILAESFMSYLGESVGGDLLQGLVVVSASLLLIMACNTAMVGNYHVNIRLVEQGFLPALFGRRSRRFGTPFISIAISALVPAGVLIATKGDVSDLGDLYSFGLLGGLTLSSICVDRLRWIRGVRGFRMGLGIFTSACLGLAWGINFFNKPASLIFGGSLTGLFMLGGLGVRRGWFEALARRFPMLGPLLLEQTVTRRDDASVITLGEAENLLPFYPVRTVVAVREASPSLLRTAAEWANKNGERTLAVVFVDEIPGMFYPPKTGPSEDAQRVLADAVRQLAEREIKALPIWRMGHDAADSIASTVRVLKAKVLYMGVSRRSTLWKVLRGHVVQGLKRSLKDIAEVRLAR
jgi:amino acid transporter